MRIIFNQKNDHANSAGMIKAMKDAGHEVCVLVSHRAGTKSAETTTGVPAVVLPYGRLSLRIWGARKKRLDILGFPDLAQLQRVMRRFSPELVLVKDLRTVSFCVLVLARLRGARVAFMWNKPRFARKWPVRSQLAAALLPRAKIHMGYYGTVGERTHLGGLLGSSTLLPYPIPRSANPRLTLPDRADDRGRAPRPVEIVAVGSLTNAVKRLAWVTQAIQRCGLGGRVNLTYIGLGSAESPAHIEIREFERIHGMQEATFLFNLPHDEVLSRLHQFDVLAHPAHKENFGAVITEAMAAGLAVLCSNRCGAKVCLEHGRSGLVFAAESQEDFDAKLRILVEDSVLRESLGAAARATAETTLAPEAWMRSVERLTGPR